MLYKVHYRTRGGASVMLCYSLLADVADQLERLWQGRIQAKAVDATGERIGAVCKDADGRLTWYCWEE